MSASPRPIRSSTTARARCCSTPCATGLLQLGWSEIEIIDEDLGCSAAGGTTRAGFERMVAEVCLGKVGAVAAREVSRFARNSRDWQQLVEMCRVVDTLLIDQEAVYAPRQGNDRLLLGLKGSLNEYELDLLRQRSLAARYEKARRGELVVAAPVGFIKAATGWRRIPTGACRRRSGSPSTRSPNLAACGRRCSGFSSMGSTCRPGSTAVRGMAASALFDPPRVDRQSGLWRCLRLWQDGRRGAL